ncbi:MAG: hypothetical protein LBJ46_07180, partial [Planctomycetota bacterium]|nr:hypothetical protein [Planctomycetota bacterium]
ARSLLEFPGITFFNKSFALAEYASPTVNTRDHYRLTAGQPGDFTRTIHILGASQAYGAPCEDAHTIASFLQCSFSRNGDATTRVVNYGINATEPDHALLQAMALDIKPGDDVVLIRNLHRKSLRKSLTDDMALLSEIHHVCSGRKAAFHFVLPQNSLLIQNPTEREKLLQCIEAQDGRPGKGAATLRKNRDKLVDAVAAMGISFVDLSRLFDRPHSLGEVFADSTHYNHRGNRAIAGEIYDRALGPGAKRPAPASVPVPAVSQKRKAVIRLKKEAIEQYARNRSIAAWLERVRNPEFEGRQKIGAIAVNCNPFTRGHAHLIGEAARRLDGLYIFVVQEDKSAFPFADRLRLVKEGTADLGDKVWIVPSGDFIISSFSFAGYFAKEDAVKPADSTMDAVLFGSVIAPALGIMHRFVGEEPNCLTTNEYNETMLFLLPDMGVEMHVIPRLRAGDAPISASSVRQAIRENDADAIRRLVPESTFRYLAEKGYVRV